MAARIALAADGALRGAPDKIYRMKGVEQPGAELKNEETKKRSLSQHQAEIERNRRAWEAKPLLQRIYAGFYERILGLIDPAVPGQIVEIGSGIGNLKAHLPKAIAADFVPNPWLDLRFCGS